MPLRDLVALRKESVDRNTSIDNLTQGVFKSLSARRAWIEILGCVGGGTCLSASLSARRAWIEMFFSRSPFAMSRVALRKESVDRNAGGSAVEVDYYVSLSARRAWIEMRKITITVDDVTLVALRKESVDRNA